MASIIDVKEYVTLTETINRLKSPNRFGMKLLFGDHQTLASETVELSSVQANRETAPFVLKNADPILVTGATETVATITGPNISIARPFTPTELLFKRHPGGAVYVNSQDDIVDAVEKYKARELSIVADLISNTEEVLVWQIMAGQIAYAVNDGSVFQLTVPRDASLVIDPGAGNYFESAGVDPLTIVHGVKRAMDTLDGFVPTDAILGSAAASAFLANAEVKKTITYFNNQGIGRVTYEENYREDGVMYLGRYLGIDWWEYSRKVLIAGVSTDLISPKYGHFVAKTAGADRKMYYAAISDLDAYEGRNMVTERFTKSWIQKMPSAYMTMTISRPFPWLRQPNAQAYVKLVA